MTILAEVIADSVPIGRPDLRIATVRVTYPRYVLAECNTHRVFSRSYSSSRAIPVKRLIASIRANPAMPLHWGINRPGMQATEEATGWRLFMMRSLWLAAMWSSTTLALLADRLGIHKQVVNRMVEPWAHVTGVITSTEWANFFALRRHPDADPVMQGLANAIYDALKASTPVKLDRLEWHMPFVTSLERAHHPTEICLAMSAARCARASYNLFNGGRTTPADDVLLAEKLRLNVPPHASPFEHQAKPIANLELHPGGEFCHNLRGWASQRSFFKGESLPGWPSELIGS